jgi:hypothetical protein
MPGYCKEVAQCSHCDVLRAVARLVYERDFQVILRRMPDEHAEQLIEALRTRCTEIEQRLTHDGTSQRLPR